MRTDSRTAVAFGKLPDRGDFVRYNAEGAAVSAVENWIQNGLRAAANVSSFKTVYQTLPPYHFWFDAGPSAGILAGTVHPSHDRVGREYPFFVAREVDPDSYDPAQLPEIPGRWNHYFDQSDRLALAAKAGRLSSGRMTSRLKLLARDVADGSLSLNAYQEFLKRTTLKEFCERTWNEFDDSRKYLLFKNLIAIVVPLQARVPAQFSLALRFPLGSDITARVFEVGFWLDTSLRLLNTAEVRPSFFWTASTAGPETSPFLLLALQPPSARYFAYLFAGLKDDELCPLDQIGLDGAEEAGESLPGPLYERLNSRKVRLEQFVRELTHVRLKRGP
jgi:type VI secretion system protein ImpM